LWPYGASASYHFALLPLMYTCGPSWPSQASKPVKCGLNSVAVHLCLLVLVVIVDLVIPEECLVTIPPEEVPRSHVLVRIFHALLKRRQVLPMFPMFVPQVVGVDGCEDEAGNDDID